MQPPTGPTRPTPTCPPSWSCRWGWPSQPSRLRPGARALDLRRKLKGWGKAGAAVAEASARLQRSVLSPRPVLPLLPQPPPPLKTTPPRRNRGPWLQKLPSGLVCLRRPDCHRCMRANITKIGSFVVTNKTMVRFAGTQNAMVPSVSNILQKETVPKA